MLDRPFSNAEFPLPRRRRAGRRHRPSRAWGRPVEQVDADFDDAPLDDLRRQADTGRIDVADL